MKTFADAHFSIRRNPAGIMGKIDLGNDVEISIIMQSIPMVVLGDYGRSLVSIKRGK